MKKSASPALVLILSVVILFGLGTDQAQAFKPYTHNYSGFNAYADAVDNGKVWIGGAEFPINPAVVQALKDHPGHYNAGVVGPDGYPDSIMGQATIHPGDDPETTDIDEGSAGDWMAFVLNKAWDAQADGRYLPHEKAQILAFSYGYLTHAAGDMWAHTLVNDFSRGVFPPVTGIPGDPLSAAIAIRHLILEGYIGDATPGFDGTPDREQLANGDWSDDSTPGIFFASPPNLFLWETFIGRAADSEGKLTLPLAGQPSAERSVLIEFFYDLRNDLHEQAGTNSNWEDLLNDFNDVKAAVNAVISACSPPPNIIDCPVALAELGLETFDLLVLDELLTAAVEEVVDAYLRAWVEDIDNGLRNWGNVGYAFTAGLFDPQTRRDLQFEECNQKDGADSDPESLRAECEDAIGFIDTFLDTMGEGFTTADPHLLSMLGAPDVLGDVVEFVDEVFDDIDAFIDFPNPLAVAIDELSDWLKERVLEMVSDVLGFDVELWADIVRNPAAYLDGTPLPPPLDQIQLFNAGDHERLDAILGLPADHHRPDKRLKPEVRFDNDQFAPMKNTIVTAKLVLLDGAQLNGALTHLLGRDIATYPAGDRTNVMFTPLNDSQPWLQSIDSDHAWRRDGLPVFCDPGTDCASFGRPQPPAVTRAENLRGGTGRMPIWESCVLRPAFGMLFTDWENGSQQWPALGDDVSADAASDPNAPTSTLSLSGKRHTRLGRVYIGKDHEFALTATDTPANKGFAPNELNLRYRVDGGNWVSASQGTEFSILGLADGKHTIDIQSGDPCHTLNESDSLPAENVQSLEFWLDTTPPVVTCANPPFNRTWDTDDFATVDYSVSDGDGSGVMSESSIINKFEVPTGTRVTFDGDVIDMYMHYPDTVTVTVTAEDFVGNAGNAGCYFELEATPDSLINNLNRARAEGDVPGSGAYNGLSAELTQVKKNHDRAKHATEWNVLDAFIGDLEAQRGKGIDLIVANRFIAFAKEIIVAGR